MVLTSIGAWLWSHQMPTDKSLVAHFHKNEKVFDELKNMLTLEPKKITGMAVDGVFTTEKLRRIPFEEAGVSEKKFQKYQNLLDNSDSTKIQRKDREIIITSGFWGWGFASKGPRVSYVFCTHSPPNQVAELKEIGDAKRKSGKGWAVVYLPVGENWYIRLVW